MCIHLNVFFSSILHRVKTLKGNNATGRLQTQTCPFSSGYHFHLNKHGVNPRGASDIDIHQGRLSDLTHSLTTCCEKVFTCFRKNVELELKFAVLYNYDGKCADD